MIFSASQDEISQIYALNTESKTTKKLTSAAFGASDAIYDTQSNSLFMLTTLPMVFVWQQLKHRISWMKLSRQICQTNFPLANELTAMGSLVIDTLAESDKLYAEKKHSKLAHLFNFHSWSPAYIDVDNISLKPGISLFSQNSLSTMVTELGYAYDLNEQVGKTSVNLQYRGFYPILNAGFSTGLRRDETVVDTTVYKLKWQETNWTFSAQLPLNFTRNKWIRGLQPGFSVRFLKRTMNPEVGLNFRESSATAFSYDVYAYQQLRLSKRDIYPRFGQISSWFFGIARWLMNLPISFFAATNMYFPGLFKHHASSSTPPTNRKTAGFTVSVI